MASSDDSGRNRGLATLADETAVDNQKDPYKVQDRRTSYDITIAREYARLLGLNKKGTPVQQTYIKGTEPVVINEEALVIRPHPNGGISEK